MKHNCYIFLIILLSVFACKEPEARRPKKHSVNNFYKEVIAQSKKMNKLENEKIKQMISSDTIFNFKPSNNGFWYAYTQKDTIKTLTPKSSDLVTISYNVTNLSDHVIYKEQEVTYKVDKQDFIPGLDEGIKLLKEGEEAIFIIPSYIAYGVTGDGTKIKMNQTIKSTVKLIQIKQNNEIN